MRDLRDPALLGERVLWVRDRANLDGYPLHLALDKVRGEVLRVPNYSANPGTIEKYGRPQDLPSTL